MCDHLWLCKCKSIKVEIIQMFLGGSEKLFGDFKKKDPIKILLEI